METVPLVDEISLWRATHCDNSIYLSLQKASSELGTLYTIILYSILVGIVRYCIKHAIFGRLADSFNLVIKADRDRFIESAWYTVYYCIYFCWGIAVYRAESWDLFPTTNMWNGWPVQPISPSFRRYYLLEMSFYIVGIFALVLEKRQKDFPQMIVHHFATLLLIGTSYWVRYHRVGLIILIVHNAADILLYLSKSMNYVNKNYKQLQLLTSATFIAFAVVFFVSRIVIFPFVVIPSTMFEVTDSPGYGSGCNLPPLVVLSNVALLILASLHVFWLYLILTMMNSIVRNPEAHCDDIRSDSEGEEQNEKSDARKKTNKRKTKKSALKGIGQSLCAQRK